MARRVETGLTSKEQKAAAAAFAAKWKDRGYERGECQKFWRSTFAARALYPDSSLADLYDPLTMPPELRKAHQANDAAVLAAYGFNPKSSESEIVAKLFERYARLTRKVES